MAESGFGLWKIVLITTLVFAVFTGVAHADSPWPMFGHDPQHTGQSLFVGAQSNNVKWSYSFENAVYSEPVIDPNNVIYVRTGGGDVHAINPDGTLKWEFHVGGSDNYGSLAIGKDGTIYACIEDFSYKYDRVLYAFNQDGTLKWKFNTSADVPPAIGPDTSTTIGPDGTIYFIGTKMIGDQLLNVLYAFNSDGVIKWNSTLEGYAHSAPAIADDGSIYLASQKLWAFNNIGVPKWNFSATDDSWYGQPIIGSDGIIYMATEEQMPLAQNLVAVNPDGTLKWRTFVDTYYPYYPYRPAISEDGTIYLAGTVGRYIIAINSLTGTLKWSYETKEFLWWPSTPAIGADGTIYIGTESGNFSAINPDGTLKWVYETEECGTAAPYFTPAAIGSDGTLYVGSNSPTGNHKLYAFIPSEENIPPTANFTYSPKNPIVNQIITFNASNSTDPDGTIVKYEWDFGDGSTATGKIVTHSYPSLGAYTVTLTVTDDDGATDVETKAISIGGMPDVPFFSQRNPNWKNDDIKDKNGNICGNISNIGCAMTCTAMLLKYYGKDTDPGRLNGWLNEHEGYVVGGYLYWEKPAE